MAGFVPDASATMPWCFGDEATPWTDALFDRIAAGEDVVVPAHWPLEVANSLLTARRKGRVTDDDVVQFIRDLTDLPIRIEAPLAPALWTPVLELAVRHRLTVYDAAYLELACRTGLPLATLDSDLLRSAAAEGVALVS